MSCKNSLPVPNQGETIPYAHLNIDDLQFGIAAWRTHSNWPRDFHGQLYQELKQLREPELRFENWKKMVDILWSWRAIRPATKEFIITRGELVLEQINVQVKALLKNHKGMPSLENVTWDEIESLFTMARNIKNVQSPVFASKMCHFLLPNVFPVIDNDLIGVKDTYQDYWLRCQKIWRNTTPDQKETHQKQMGQFISLKNQKDFPWATKIVEICLAGQKNKNMERKNGL